MQDIHNALILARHEATLLHSEFLSILKLFKCESNHNRSGSNIKCFFLKIINYVRILMFKKRVEE